MKEIPIFISGNASKIAEIGRNLHTELPHQKLDLIEIQSLSLEEVVIYKAREAFVQMQKPVLVEDTSLSFTALNGLPGPLIKWFLQALGNAGLSQLIPENTDRSALAEVRFAYCDGDEVLQFVGQTKGTIAKEPRGGETFGWDPIFIPNGHTKTWGEMSDEEKDATSMRSIALKKLQQFLES